MKMGYHDDSPERIQWEINIVSEIAGYLEGLGVEPDIMFGFGVMLAAHAVRRTACEQHVSASEERHADARRFMAPRLVTAFIQAPVIASVRGKLARAARGSFPPDPIAAAAQQVAMMLSGDSDYRDDPTLAKLNEVLARAGAK